MWKHWSGPTRPGWHSSLLKPASPPESQLYLGGTYRTESGAPLPTSSPLSPGHRDPPPLSRWEASAGPWSNCQPVSPGMQRSCTHSKRSSGPKPPAREWSGTTTSRKRSMRSKRQSTVVIQYCGLSQFFESDVSYSFFRLAILMPNHALLALHLLVPNQGSRENTQ